MLSILQFNVNLYRISPCLLKLAFTLEYRHNHYKYWGKPGDSQNVKIDWHIPSDAEKDLALELLDNFLKPSITRLKELMATGTDEEGKPLGTREMSNEFCRHLSIVRNCLTGTNTMVYDDGDNSLSEFRYVES